jgi:hypothetical protein
MAETVKRAPRKKKVETETVDAPNVAAPEAAPPVTKAPPTHPYGDVEVFVYQPKDGSAPIVMPAINTVRPTQKFFWTIYRLNEMFQSFEWLNLAKVPRSVQERIMDLGEKDVYEQADLFRQWFAPISRPQAEEGLRPPGES